MEFNQAELDHFRNSQKAHSTKKRESRVWGTLRIWDKFAFFLYGIAFLLLLTSIFLFAFPSLLMLISMLGMAAIMPPALLLLPKATLFQIATGTFIASVLLLLLARWRVLHNRALRPECGCPVCQERELIRVPRKRRDRMFSFVGVTAWRYACRNCMWGGLRVGGQQPLPAQKPVKAVPVAAAVIAPAEVIEVDPVLSALEAIAYESAPIMETQSVAAAQPLDMFAAVEHVQEDIVELPKDIIEHDDVLLIETVEETAVHELPISEVEAVLSNSEPVPVAADDVLSNFDSEFERLCYEVAQAK